VGAAQHALALLVSPALVRVHPHPERLPGTEDVAFTVGLVRRPNR